MITIPEYVFRDGNIKFKCPALEMCRRDAVLMHTALTDPNWPDVLKEKEYICHAMKKLGFKSTLISKALKHQYDCSALDGCLYIATKDDWSTLDDAANIIRRAWCDHMSTHLSMILSQG